MKLEQLTNSALFVEELSEVEMESIQGGNIYVSAPPNATAADIKRLLQFVDRLNKLAKKQLYILQYDR